MKTEEREITISYRALNAIRDIIWMARRYADGRSTYAPSMFNDAYDVLRNELEDTIDKAVDAVVPTFPYAQDGQFDAVKDRKYAK